MRNGAPQTRDWKARVRARIGALHVDPMRETEIVDELAQHVAEHYADLTASGMADADAVAAALAPLDPARVAAEIARADRPTRVAGRLKPPSGAPKARQGSWSISLATSATLSACCGGRPGSPPSRC
jgi:hypothetical protein